jgi:hypothetical protein
VALAVLQDEHGGGSIRRKRSWSRFVPPCWVGRFQGGIRHTAYGRAVPSCSGHVGASCGPVGDKSPGRSSPLSLVLGRVRRDGAKIRKTPGHKTASCHLMGREGAGWGLAAAEMAGLVGRCPHGPPPRRHCRSGASPAFLPAAWCRRSTPLMTTTWASAPTRARWPWCSGRAMRSWPATAQSR